MPSSLLCGVRRSLLGRAKAFTPASLPGLVLWLDPTYGLYQETTGASATTPAVADGDPVGTWLARTGQYLTAASDTERPTLKPVSGFPLVRTDGVDDMLASAAPVTTKITFSMFAVHKFNAKDSSGILCHNGSTDGWGFVLHGAVTTADVLFENVGNNDFACADATATYRLWQALYGGSTLRAYSEGALQLTSTPTQPSPPTTRFSVGNGGNLTSKTAHCDVREIVIYDRVITEAERLQVQSYLQARWGVT